MAEVEAAATGVSFEVERFAWRGADRLEVEGRWYGIRGRRFLRPTLDVEVDGIPRRVLAVLEHKPWAADDGERWLAAFEWTGEPVELDAAELAVGPDLAVELPPPSGTPAGKAPRRRAGRRREARPPRVQALEAELAATRAELDEVRARLAAEQKAGRQREEGLEALREEKAAAEASAGRRLEEARAERDAALAAQAAAATERDAAVAASEAAGAERDAAVAEAAKANSDRDKAQRERTAVERELAAAIRARDKARHERNAWLSRARAAVAGQGLTAVAKGTAPARQDPADREPTAEREARPATPSPAREAPSAQPPAREAPSAERPPRAAPSASREPTRVIPAPPGDLPGGAPPSPGEGPAPSRRKLRRTPLPPGGILLPPTGPGSHARRSIVGRVPRVLLPVVLVLLFLLVVVLIAWAL